MSLARRAGLGIAWAYGAFVGQRLLTLATTAVLARLLFPADFGVIAFALVLLELVDAIRDSGIRDALIFAPGAMDEAADTALLMSLGIGLAQCAIVVLLAPLASLAIADPRVVDVLRLLSLTFPINAIANAQQGLLQKAMEFRRSYVVDIASTIAKAVVTIVLAFAGLGLWSLVAGQLGGAVVRTAGRWLAVDWRPRLRFRVAQARMLLGYGVYVMLVRIIDVILERADQLLIAFLLGEVELAYYYLAARIPQLVIANFNQVLTQVLFPVYASIKEDRERLTRAYGEATKYTALVIVPAGLGLAATAPELVPVLFGPQWLASIRLVQILSLVGIAASLPWSAGDVFKAIGRPDIPTKLVLLESCYSFPLVLAFGLAWHQAIWIALAYLIALFITAIIRLWMVRRFLRLPAWFYGRLFRVPFAGGVAMAVVVTLWRQAVASWPQGLILATSVLIGALVYGALVWLLARDDVRHAWANGRSLFGRPSLGSP